jgi:HEAT repeat protein
MIKKIRDSIGFIISILVLTSCSFSQEINIAHGKTVLSLINKLSDKDPFVNGEAVDSLVSYGNSAVGYLIKSLADENDNVRWCSAIALGKIAPEGIRAIPFLIESLKDKNPDVRWCSAIAL